MRILKAICRAAKDFALAIWSMHLLATGRNL